MNFTPENIIALTTAGCALVLTIYQIWQNQRHDKLSVKPHLSSTKSYNKKDKVFDYCISIDNNGIGPAAIKDVTLYYNGEEVSHSAPQKYRQFMDEQINSILSPSEKHNANLDFAIFDTDESLSAGKSYRILHIKNFPLSVMEDFITFINSTKITIEYESIYGDKMLPCIVKSHLADNPEFSF